MLKVVLKQVLQDPGHAVVASYPPGSLVSHGV